MKMLDYHLHFAQLVTEDQLRNAERRRAQRGPRDGAPRVVRLPDQRRNAGEARR